MPRRTPRPLAVVALLAALALPCSSRAQVTQSGAAASAALPDYHRAEQFLTWNELRHIYGDFVAPRAMRSGSRFWYRVSTPRGPEFIVVDPVTLRRAPLFDNGRLAAAMSAEADTAYDPTRLPFKEFRFADDGRDERHIEVQTGKRRFVCDIVAYRCTVGDTLPNRIAFARSPDGKWDAFIRGHNVYVRAVGAIDSIALTTDGADLYGYGNGAPRVTQQRQHTPSRPTLQWSPDSRKIAVARFDERRVKDFYLLSMTPSRPVLYTYPYALPGDSVIPTFDIHILDVAARTNVKVDVPPQNAQDNGLTGMRDSTWISVRWADRSDKLYFTYGDRGPKHVQLFVADAGTGHARPIVADTSRTYVELNLESGGDPNWAIADDGASIVWFSERDGWGHLYLFGADGKLRDQITRGAWTVGDIEHVDPVGHWIYFTGRGRESGEDPYFAHLYRVHFDGSALALLTPEPADHTIWMTPDGRYVVDSYSRVDAPPVTVLRAPDGRVLSTLEKADIHEMVALGWRAPEPFRVKARDGITDIYGVLYKPTTFDSTRKYPVIDHIYPGPQIIASPKGFFPTSTTALVYSQMGQVQALAELGFIVVEVDAMGTNMRSKAFHDMWYANMGDNGIPDHIAALKQLGLRHSWMDLTRVGIYGHSGGGFASTDALLRYPDFYKVAVSSSGNHDNRTYYYGWAERYQGLLVRDTLRKSDNYENQVNYLQAKNLRGKLFLIHGDLDDNVHPAMTIQLVDALVKANKSFDLLIMPNRNHGLTQEPYVIRRTWDYFVRNLLGVDPPADYAIAPEVAPSVVP